MRVPAAALAAASILGALPALAPSTAGSPVSRIDAGALLHDTRNPMYRSPFGAVPAGRPVSLGFRTARAGATAVTLEAAETDGSGKVIRTFSRSMRRARSFGRYDLWRATVTPTAVGVLDYQFRVRARSAQLWYADTALQEGGRGQPYQAKVDTTFRITVYRPDFRAPSWTADAVVYQIFPDRFYDGDPSNNIPFRSSVSVPAVNGQCPPGSYGKSGQCAYTHTSWSELPDKSKQNVDFFGGDLQGIVDKLQYLKGLGVNTLYLNPIFQAASNHKYDTGDYLAIDPHFGTMETFRTLIAQARTNGIRVVLDGVFNHTGDDSIYFNKYGRFPDVGAYQSKSSPYYAWYTFFSWPNSYDSWPDSPDLPVLTEIDPVKDYIFRKPDSVAQYWPGQGAVGWRLDAAQNKSHAWWQEFRSAVKARFPNAVLITEDTAGPINATPFLLGNEMDGVMNYRFREAVLRYFARGQGATVLAPSRVSSLYSSLMSILEDYPLPAVFSSMNLIDSHDTERILFDLNGDRRELRQIVTLQMTWPGAPTIYYGDEAGLTGETDPDDRRTFPWGHEDTALQSFYRKLIAIRRAHSSLRAGTVARLVLDDKHRVLGFLRRDSREQVAVLINDDKSAHSESFHIFGLRAGAALADALTGKRYIVSGSKLTVSVPGVGALILVPARSAR